MAKIVISTVGKRMEILKSIQAGFISSQKEATEEHEFITMEQFSEIAKSHEVYTPENLLKFDQDIQKAIESAS